MNIEQIRREIRRLAALAGEGSLGEELTEAIDDELFNKYSRGYDDGLEAGRGDWL